MTNSFNYWDVKEHVPKLSILQLSVVVTCISENVSYVMYRNATLHNLQSTITHSTDGCYFFRLLRPYSKMSEVPSLASHHRQTYNSSRSGKLTFVLTDFFLSLFITPRLCYHLAYKTKKSVCKTSISLYQLLVWINQQHANHFSCEPDAV